MQKRKYAGLWIDEVKVRIKEELDLVIGDFSLCNSDIQFLKAGRLKMLEKALKNLEEEYDFIIIDTPPNLGVLSLNAFIASGYVIVPMAADSFSLKGVRLLKQKLLKMYLYTFGAFRAWWIAMPLLFNKF